MRSRVAQMGLSTMKMETPAADLSGGEKARLMMGLAAFEAPHLLILDEPTNHLDIDSREALVHALNDYDGAVILITHDRHLIEACADRLWLVANGTVKPFDGDIEEYRNVVLGRTEESAARSAKIAAGSDSRRKRAARPRSGAKRWPRCGSGSRSRTPHRKASCRDRGPRPGARATRPLRARSRGGGSARQGARGTRARFRPRRVGLARPIRGARKGAKRRKTPPLTSAYSARTAADFAVQ